MSKPKSKVTIAHVFKTIIWPRKNIILVGLLLIVISRLAGLVLPGATKFLMDDVIAKGDMHMLKLILWAVAGSILVQSVTSYMLTKILSVEAQHLISVLRARVQQQILRLPTRFFDNNKSGALVSRIMNDVEGVRNLVGTGLVQLVGGVLTSVICLVLLIQISPWMTLYVLVPVLIFGLISMKAFAYIRPVFRERGVITAEVTGRLTETLSGVRVIKGYHAEEREEAVFATGVRKLLDNVMRTLTATSVMSLSASVLLGLVGAATMYVGARQSLAGTLTPGDFFSFTLTLPFLVAPMMQIVSIGTQLTEAMAGLERTQEIILQHYP